MPTPPLPNPDQQVIQVAPVIDRDGAPRVLLQLQHGWVTMKPADARGVAALLVGVADDLDQGRWP